MSIQSYDFQAYTKEHLASLKNLASHCAGALERIWAQEALSDFVERLKILHDAVNAINANHEVEKVCQVVYETVASVMSCNDFVIDGYNKDMNLIQPIFAIEHPGIRVFANGYVADHGLAGEVVLTRRTLLFNSKQEMLKSGINFETFGSEIEEDPTESCIAVPMLLHDEIYGMVSAQSYKKNAYNRDDLYLLEVLASHAAIAIENAHLFDSIQTLANTDALTGLLNRRRFFELAEAEYEKAKLNAVPLSVILLDVDDFKLFNDQHGHSVGDAVLGRVAEVCSAHLRSNDILGRMGGEEFAVVLPETTLSEALEVAERLRYAIEYFEFKHDPTLHVKNAPHLITVSVGVAEYSSDCNSLDELLDMADKAMYQSKNLGRNRVHVWRDGK